MKREVKRLFKKILHSHSWKYISMRQRKCKVCGEQQSLDHSGKYIVIEKGEFPDEDTKV